MAKFLRLTILLTILLGMAVPVYAQESVPDDPVYIVDNGDNLTSVANRFGISVDELISANSIVDPNSLKVGDKLIIPGLKGISGVLATRTVGFADTLHQMSIEYNIPVELLTKLNHITSPDELYAGVDLVVPQASDEQPKSRKYLLAKNQSILEIAILSGVNPWQIEQANKFPSLWSVSNGYVVYLPPNAVQDVHGLSSLPLESVKISPLPMIQGETTQIDIRTNQQASLTGMLTDHILHFFPNGEGNQTSIQGIHALTEPGLYPLDFAVTLADGTNINYQQMVIIQDGFYPKDPIIYVKDEFIDPAITVPEQDWLTSLTTPASTEKMWSGLWTSPSPSDYRECLNSRYGNRRSYNGSAFTYFHSGVDFCGGEGMQIFAPAVGRVVFAGQKSVRGNATIIDHGWGVYSGYWHQSQIVVNVGDVVEAGQLIGYVGGTGRVTGAHLHWEVWVGGVQVNPLLWLEQQFPSEQ